MENFHSEKNKNQKSDARLGEPFFNLSPRGNHQAAFLIFVFSCFLFGIVMSALVGGNTKEYWRFLEEVTVSDIEKIEVQRIETNLAGIGEPVILTDQDGITHFISAIKNAQKTRPNGRYAENRTKVTVWLKNNHIIEFVCFTTNGTGKDILVGYVFVRPSIYSFGNGSTIFPESDFYDWLVGIGIDMSN